MMISSKSYNPAPWAPEILLVQAEDAFCQANMKELDAFLPPDPTWSRQAFFFL